MVSISIAAPEGSSLSVRCYGVVLSVVDLALALVSCTQILASSTLAHAMAKNGDARTLVIKCVAPFVLLGRRSRQELARRSLSRREP